jgi:hypothetical protein
VGDTGPTGPTGDTGPTWNIVTANTSADVDNGYVTDHATNRLEITLPATAAAGKIVRVSGMGLGGWKIKQNAGQYIKFANLCTVVGTTGYLSSNDDTDAVEMLCIVEDDGWTVISSIGNVTVV